MVPKRAKYGRFLGFSSISRAPLHQSISNSSKAWTLPARDWNWAWLQFHQNNSVFKIQQLRLIDLGTFHLSGASSKQRECSFAATYFFIKLSRNAFFVSFFQFAFLVSNLENLSFPTFSLSFFSFFRRLLFVSEFSIFICSSPFHFRFFQLFGPRKFSLNFIYSLCIFTLNVFWILYRMFLMRKNPPWPHLVFPPAALTKKMR